MKRHDLDALDFLVLTCVLIGFACSLQSVIMLSLSGGSIWPCDFQEGFCQWFQLNDGDFNWTRHQGKTASHNTGPDTDATTGTSELLRKMNIMTIFFTPLQTRERKPFDDKRTSRNTYNELLI